jgi:imidazolonepropionase-like amidohydrolase
VLLGLVALLATAPLAAQEKAVVIRGGMVIPVDGAPIPNGTVVLRGGKIVAVGSNVPVPSGAEIVDARGKWVLPGLIDAMTSIGFAGNDLNENSNSVTPELRAFEAYNPFGTFGAGKPGPLRNVEMLSGGVTTIYIASADAALIAGQGAVLKTAGNNLDALVIREPASMDMALGEPPKRPARAANRDPATRMAEIAMIRAALIKAQEYAANQSERAARPRHGSAGTPPQEGFPGADPGHERQGHPERHGPGHRVRIRPGDRRGRVRDAAQGGAGAPEDSGRSRPGDAPVRQ